MATSAKKKVRKYSIDYLKYGFIPASHDERLPFCLLCEQTLCNDSMRPTKLEQHLGNKHGEYAAKPLNYFKELKVKRETELPKRIDSLFRKQSANLDRGMEASYEISLLIAKTGKPHSIGEELIKPALSVFARTVLRGGDTAVNSVPLSNDTVRRRIDEMAVDVHSQLVSKLRKVKFTVQLDESTVRQGEALLLAYVRYIDEEEFKEEMLFCEALKTTTNAADIYRIYKQYMTDNDIPLHNVLSCAADGAPTMMGRRQGVLKLMKDDNPSMMTVHCVIHRENLVAKNLSPELHVVMKAVIKCINSIKANAKTERLFKAFCEDMEESHVRLLLHTEVRWLSKGNCLARFVELFDRLDEFLANRDEMAALRGNEAKVQLFYLSDIFAKLNALNADLQGRNKTLLDAKIKIFGFVTKLRQYRAELSRREFDSFISLSKCDVSDETLTVIVNHIDSMITDFSQRFVDLEGMKFPSWVTQYSLVELSEVEPRLRDEVADLQNDASAVAIHKSKRQFMWLHQEIVEKYPNLSSEAQKLILPFPTSYLVECAFSAVTDILTKKRGSLDITHRGDLRLKLTKLIPDINTLVREHQAQGSH